MRLAIEKQVGLQKQQVRQDNRTLLITPYQVAHLHGHYPSGLQDHGKTIQRAVPF